MRMKKHTYSNEIYVSLGSWDSERLRACSDSQTHAKDRHGYNNEMEMKMKKTREVEACTFCIAYQIGGFVWIFSFYSHFDIVFHTHIHTHNEHDEIPEAIQWTTSYSYPLCICLCVYFDTHTYFLPSILRSGHELSFSPYEWTVLVLMAFYLHVHNYSQ